ncbi:MAG: (2Fe-2S)-binding protein [Dermatophilus congolensis]|nr:(2Fe-2S)-binding protein [Dermatophilus congolensis]
MTGFGPFIDAQAHRPDDPVPTGWSRLSALVDDPAVFSARAEAVRAALEERRVAAGSPGRTVAWQVAVSTAHLGLVARFVAATCAARAQRLPMAFDARDVWWRDVHGGPVPLSLPQGTSSPIAPNEPRIDPWVEAFTQVTVDVHGLSAKVAWGNVAAAANSAAVLMSQARPDLYDTVHALADRILADPRVEGGTLRAGPDFRRRSCCLIYKVSGNRQAVCGDCVLR